jgi:hypothetical protein
MKKKKLPKYWPEIFVQVDDGNGNDGFEGYAKEPDNKFPHWCDDAKDMDPGVRYIVYRPVEVVEIKRETKERRSALPKVKR